MYKIKSITSHSYSSAMEKLVVHGPNRSSYGYYLFLMVFMFLFVACSNVQNDPEADYSFLTNEPCAPPCWHGLKPGQSSGDDVLATLKVLPFVDINSIQEYKTSWFADDEAKSIYFGCIHPKTGDCGDIIVSNNIMRRITLTVKYSLTQKLVVDKLGAPAYLDYGGYHPEVGGCIVMLVWPELGIASITLDKKTDELCNLLREGQAIPQDTKITSLSYFISTEVIDFQPSGGNHRITWPGFLQP